MNIDKNKLATIGFVAIIGILGLLILRSNDNTAKTSQKNLSGTGGEYAVEPSTASAMAKNDTSAETVIVQIAGEVNKPDVYELDNDARLKDLVEMAGGFTENAYTDNLNLAERLEDGYKYIVYNATEDIDKIETLEDNIPDAEQGNGLININTADVQTLKQLNGIGDTLAERIIEYRESCGDFTSIEEIREVEGIGDGIYNKIKDDITINSSNKGGQ